MPHTASSTGTPHQNLLSKRPWGYLLLGALGLLFHLTELRAQTDPGLYAVFNTNQGTFVCRLHFERTPRTVANFVSLAEGTRPWVNFQQPGISRARYYDGITFHRVVSGFVIQAGSPNGMGNDGPGYTIQDEFHPDLRHDKAGILSMAKTSAPDSGGSQFFVTLAETPWLDNVHSVFGEVVQGLDTVNTIGTTATDDGSRPLEPQVILSITILRIGAEAEAFNPNALEHPLPNVAFAPAQIERTPEGLDITWPMKENHAYHAFFSSNLTDWSAQTLNAEGRASLANFIATFNEHFFFFIESSPDPEIPAN